MKMSHSYVRSTLLACLTMIIAVAPVSSGLALFTTHEPPLVASLGIDEFVFWEGFAASADSIPALEVTRGQGGLSCETGSACHDYAIDIVAGAWRLRVALDTPLLGSTRVDLALISPDGTYHAPDVPLVKVAPLAYSYEVYVLDPAPGTWTARAIVNGGTDVAYSMRAKLESAPAPEDGVSVLPPDMRSEPPFGLGFSGCTEDEKILYDPERCLRFAFGWHNAGRGMLDLRYGAPEEETRSRVTQRTHSSDGTFTESFAGWAEFHPVHGHYHYLDFVLFELYRVTDTRAGTLEGPLTSGTKLGVCGHDWKIVDWTEFYQHESGSEDSGVECADGAALAPLVRQALSAGWLDYYGRGTPGNFVDFGSNGDGEYILRMLVDPMGQLVEVREDNNVAYAHFTVSGEDVTLLERGQGLDSWDPARTLLGAQP